MITRTLGAVATALCMATPATASDGVFLDGNRLLSYLTSSQVVDRTHATGYVLAVSDSYDGVIFCTPNGVVAKQLTDISHQYLVARPQMRHLSATLLVAAALANAYPCDDKSKVSP